MTSGTPDFEAAGPDLLISQLPGLTFHLRRSPVVRTSGLSPDEITYFRRLVTYLYTFATRALVPPVGGVDVSPIIWVGMISFMNEILLGKQGLLVLLANKQLGG